MDNEPEFNAPQKVTNTQGIFDRYVMGKRRIIEWKTLDGENAYGAYFYRRLSTGQALSTDRLPIS